MPSGAVKGVSGAQGQTRVTPQGQGCLWLHSLPDVQVHSSVGMGTHEGEILGCFYSRDQALLPLWAGWWQWTYFQHLHFSGGWGMNFSRLPHISPLLWLFINQFAHLYYENSIYNFTSLYPKFLSLFLYHLSKLSSNFF